MNSLLPDNDNNQNQNEQNNGEDYFCYLKSSSIPRAEVLTTTVTTVVLNHPTTKKRKKKKKGLMMIIIIIIFVLLAILDQFRNLRIVTSSSFVVVDEDSTLETPTVISSSLNVATLGGGQQGRKTLSLRKNNETTNNTTNNITYTAQQQQQQQQQQQKETGATILSIESPIIATAASAASAPSEVTTHEHEHEHEHEQQQHAHILMALSGNHHGLMKEFEMTMKSILMNAPDSSPLTIHIMADKKAHTALSELLLLFDTTSKKGGIPDITKWISKYPIVIRTYDCTRLLPQWKDKIENLYDNPNILKYHSALIGRKAFMHTIGTWFRLLADDVLFLSSSSTKKDNSNNGNNHNITNVLYLDTDIIIMANLQDLFNQIEQDNDDDPSSYSYSFYWGKTQCAGFMILNIANLSHMWEVVSKAYGTKMNILKKHMKLDNADQSFLTAYQYELPNNVKTLPDRWDNSWADQLYKSRSTLLKDRPQIGYLHFNGGGGSKQSWFAGNNDNGNGDDNDNKKKDNNNSKNNNTNHHHDYSNVPWISNPDMRNTFGMVDYYLRLPWEWARYFALSKIPNSMKGYNLTIEQIIV